MTIPAVLHARTKPCDKDLISYGNSIAKMEYTAGVFQPFAIATKMLGTVILPKFTLH